MQIWLFALVELAIAAAGVGAYLSSGNIVLAGAAAALAIVLAIVRPLLSGRKQAPSKTQPKTQAKARPQSQATAQPVRAPQKPQKGATRQAKALLKEVIEPPLPHRPSVVAGLKSAFPKEATRLLSQYDAVVKALSTGDKHAASLAQKFADVVDPWSIGPYLQALISLRAGKIEAAYQEFSKAKDAQTAWPAPWLGWALTAYRLGRIDEISAEHPQVKRVELLPYSAGDRHTFLDLDEAEQQQLTQEFEQVAAALANFHTIATSHSQRVA
jgi:hypothetical protein